MPLRLLLEKLALSSVVFLLFIFSGCEKTSSEATDKVKLLVSIAPQKFFLEKIAGEYFTVEVLVPPGGNPHAFEPTPKQILNASHAAIWFRIGEAFEGKAIQVLKGHNPQMDIVDTRHYIPMIVNSHCCGHHHHDDMDTHVWLSPKMAKIQATTMCNALCVLFPDHQVEHKENLAVFLEELDQLDQKLTSLFQSSSVKAILVSHPAFGYLCRDYALEQLSVEVEGKDPSPQQLTRLLERSKQLNINRVFTQRQYQNKGALLIAEALNAKIYEVDPYSDQYMVNLYRMGMLFSGCEEP